MIKELERYILDHKQQFGNDVAPPLLYAFGGEKPIKNKTVFVYSGDNLDPFTVGKISRTGGKNDVRGEHDKVTRYRKLFPKKISGLLPKPMGKVSVDGIPIAFYGAITESMCARWFLRFPKPVFNKAVERFAANALDTLLSVQTAAADIFSPGRFNEGYSAAFYHGDFIPVNLFYDGVAVTHVIDWEDSRESHVPLQDFFFFVINLSENALGRDLTEGDFTGGGWVCDFEEFAAPILAKHMATFNVGKDHLPTLVGMLLDEIMVREDDGLERKVSRRYDRYRDLLKAGKFYRRLVGRC